jgi:sugar phosphate isomerase/epimerase
MAILTLGWLSLLNASVERVIDAAAAARFTSVSIRITGRKLTDPFPQIVGNEQALRTLKAKLNDNGLRLSNTSTYHLSPDITLDVLKPVLDATAELGCPMLVATCLDPDHARWTEFAASYCEAAATRGLRVALEFVPFSKLKTIQTGYQVVLATGAPNFGLLVDSLHLSRSGGQPKDILNVDPNRIFFAQICDAVAERPSDEDLPAEARTGRLYPGDGKLPLIDFLDALPPGIEIECEVPIAAHQGLSPERQAKQTRRRVMGFMDDYFTARGYPNPYT